MCEHETLNVCIYVWRRGTDPNPPCCSLSTFLGKPATQNAGNSDRNFRPLKDDLNILVSAGEGWRTG